MSVTALDSYIKKDESPSFKGSNISPIKISPIKKSRFPCRDIGIRDLSMVKSFNLRSRSMVNHLRKIEEIQSLSWPSIGGFFLAGVTNFFRNLCSGKIFGLPCSCCGFFIWRLFDLGLHLYYGKFFGQLG